MPSTLYLEEALSALESQERPNYNAVAKEYNCRISILYKYHLDETTSRIEFIDIYYIALSRVQKEALVSLINKLTYRGLPPIPRIVRNLAKEIKGQFIRKN